MQNLVIYHWRKAEAKMQLQYIGMGSYLLVVKSKKYQLCVEINSIAIPGFSCNYLAINITVIYNNPLNKLTIVYVCMCLSVLKDLAKS